MGKSKGPSARDRGMRGRRLAGAHCFGSHLSISGGMSYAIESALRMRMDTVQVFVKNQRQWRAAPLRPDDVERWHVLLETPGFGPPVAHATYLINLASADRTLHARSCAAFGEELRRCDRLAIPYLVVHPGAATSGSVEEALRRVARALDRIFEAQSSVRTRVLLETTAGQGSSLGHTFEQLAAIIERVGEPQRVGVCVDTCHVHAAGYRLQDAAGYAAMVECASRTVGLERIRCWHLNDSKRECGSRVDRHEHIGCGHIGSRGFARVLGDERFQGLPMILETPKGTNAAGREWDRVNLARLRTIATRARAGRPESQRTKSASAKAGRS